MEIGMVLFFTGEKGIGEFDGFDQDVIIGRIGFIDHP